MTLPTTITTVLQVGQGPAGTTGDVTPGLLALRDQAVSSASAAAGSATAADASRATAAGAATAASGSKDAAATSASAASGSKDAAASSASAASTSAGTALTAQGVTTTASDAAIAARDASITARDASITARDTTVAARDTATTQAGVSTTKAAEAAASASAAANNAAAVNTQVGVAAGKASDAAISASAAAGSASTASTAAATSTAAQAVTVAARDDAVAAKIAAQTARDVAAGTQATVLAARDTAVTQAGNAAASATTATTKAGNAATSETNAAASAAAALASQNAANTSAGTAATQAGLATTNGQAQVTLATTQAILATTNGAAQVTLATAQANAAAGSAAVASAANTATQTLVAGTASAATQAANARDAAIIASQVATAGNESLAAISKQIHFGAIVRAALYDTSKDSDSGQWRKRTQGTSWYNENINGAWLGQAANELAARGDNLLTYPEQLNTGWALLNTSVVADQAIASDGTTTLDRIVETTGSGGHNGSQQTTVSNGLYAYSVDVMKGERTTAIVAMSDLTTGDAGVKVDLATGILSSAGLIAGSWTNVSSSIVDNKNGSYRVTVVAQKNAGTAVGSRVSLLDSTGAVSYAGDTTKGLYAGRAKLNVVGALSSTYSASPELVSNGGFDSAAGWTLNAGWDITNGTLNHTTGTTSADAPLAGGTVVGKVYAITYMITAITGSVSAQIGAISGPSRTVVGTYTDVVVASTTAALRFFPAGGATTITIDNVSVKEVTVLATPYVPYSQLAGSYYQNTTDGKFYALNATYGQTETFRGNSREFPATALIIAETVRVVIYDATQPGCPMWKVEVSNTVIGTSGTEWWRSNKALSSVSAINGRLYIGMLNTGDGSTGLLFADYAAGLAGRYGVGTTSGGVCTYASRNTAALDKSLPAIVNSAVNDVACVCLPDAPIDPATGLATPTVYAFTAGGVSRIAQDGTVSSTATGGVTANVGAGWIDGNYVRALCQNNGILAVSLPVTSALPAGGSLALNTYWNTGETYYVGSIPAVLPPNGKGVKSALGGLSGLSIVKGNPASPTKSMVANITSAYSTGYMVGDSRGAFLCDIVPEVITATQLVANGDFADGTTTGWVVSNGTLSVVNGAMRVTSTANGQFIASYAITCIPGKTYKLSTQFVTDGVTGNYFLNAGTSSSGAGNVSALNLNAASTIGTFGSEFVASQATMYISVTGSSAALAGEYFDVDNFTCKLVEYDRSVKNISLAINGSITKAAVASGSQLVAYSGFSAANYLEQPYNSALDFGTGDFSYMFWMNASNGGCLFSRGNNTAGAIVFMQTATNVFSFFIHNGSGYASIAATTAISGMGLMLIKRTGTTVELWFNGALVGSGTSALTLNNTGVLRIGERQDASLPYTGSIALFRVSATTPTP